MVLDRSSTEPLPTVEEEAKEVSLPPKAAEAENEMELIAEEGDVSPAARTAESEAPEVEAEGDEAGGDAAGEREAELAETSRAELDSVPLRLAEEPNQEGDLDVHVLNEDSVRGVGASKTTDMDPAGSGLS